MDNLDNFNDWISKTRGKASQPGPPPGPAPSQKLLWDYQSHRWVLPKEIKDASKAMAKSRIDVEKIADWDDAHDALDEYGGKNDSSKLEELKNYLQEYADLAVLGNDYPPEKLKGLFRNTLRRVSIASTESRVRAREFKEVMTDEEAEQLIHRERLAAKKLADMYNQFPDKESIMDASPEQMVLFIDKFVHMIHTQIDQSQDQARDTVLSTAFEFDYHSDEIVDSITQVVLDKLAGVFKAVVAGINLEILKARGIPNQPGPQPGPPPRAGLEWEPKTHRWTLPESSKETDEEGPLLQVEITPSSQIKPKEFIFNYTTKDEANVAFGVHEERYAKKLTKEEKEALVEYTDLGADTNEALREGKQPEETKLLDEALNKAIFPKRAVVQRYILVEPGTDLSSWEGKTVRDKGYLSTSLVHGAYESLVVDQFLNPGLEDMDVVVLNIEVPKSAKAALLNSVGQVWSNHEVLLPRNSRLLVRHVYEVKNEHYKVGNHRTLQVEALYDSD